MTLVPGPAKKPRTILMIKYDKNTITSPIIAEMICIRASSTPCLSPWERIHLIPPQIRYPSAIIVAITKTNVTAAPITVPKFCALKPQSALNCVPLGHALIVCPSANAWVAKSPKREKVVENIANLFIPIIMVGRFVMLVKSNA